MLGGKSSRFDSDDDDFRSKSKLVDLEECPVFYPSTQDFDDPFVYLQSIASEASKFGICKIVSPIKACVSAHTVLTKEIKDFKFETTVQPLRLSKNGNTTFFRRGKKYKYVEFETMANKAFLRRFTGVVPCATSLEYEFWRLMENGKKGTVEYGLNVEASAFSSNPSDHFGSTKWNLKNLSRLPRSSLRFLQGTIPGITEPMLYMGMVFSMFAWHVEDHYLYSINYHHSGAPKTWYGVPAHFASALEKIVADQIYTSTDSEDGASLLLAEKTTMFPPQILVRNNVPVYKALQMPGDFVITFPKAYHAGFSHGFNCGEAVNFATTDWFEFGAEARERYALLRVVPIIPLEELVCKEAMLLYDQCLKNKASDLKPDLTTKLCFVRIIRSYQQMQSLCHSTSSAQGTVICSICKRDCYLGYMICNSCLSYEACLNHQTHCSCGTKMTLFIREDISTHIIAAQKLDQILIQSNQPTKESSKGRGLKGKSKVKIDTENKKEKIRRIKGLLPQIQSNL